MSRKPTMKRNKLPMVVIGALVLGMAGCELLVDFDRTKIDAGPLDGTTTDVTSNDVTVDQSTHDVVSESFEDVTTTDAGDGGGDSATDAPADVTDAATADDGPADADDGAADAADD